MLGASRAASVAVLVGVGLAVVLWEYGAVTGDEAVTAADPWPVRNPVWAALAAAVGVYVLGLLTAIAVNTERRP
jgi:hypothetical protein